MKSIEYFITHAEKKGAVLKIFGQCDTNTVLFVEQNIETLKESFENGKIGLVHSVSQLIPNLVCVARSRGSKFLRAKILHVDPNRLTVRVNFIDYGYTEDVVAGDIRLLDSDVVLNLVRLDPLASEFFLAHARPHGGQWSDELINYVKQMLMSVPRKFSVLADVNNKKFISIDYDGEDFTKYLIRIGYVQHVPLETQIIQFQAEDDISSVKFNAPPPMPISMIPQKPHPMNQQRPVYGMPSQPLPRSMLPHSGPLLRMAPPQVRLPNQQYPVFPGPSARFTCDLIPENSEHSVYISHVDGPHLFTVQLKIIAENQLLKMMKRLNALQATPVSGPITPGLLCLGRFTGDNTFYRAVVVDVDDDKCKVFYADFGNTELLPCSEIFQIPDDFQNMKLMAHRFALANSKSMNFSPEFDRLFKDYVKEKAFTMKVTPSEERAVTKQYCELYYHGRNIKDIINEIIEKNRATPVVYAKATLPARGSTVRVFVSHVEAVTKVFVQLIDEQDTLTKLMSEIAEHCSDRSLTTFKANQLKPGMPVCAYYIDGQWYRAQILNVNDEEAKVLFVDYGNIDSVSISLLRYISPDLVRDVEAQAIECCLAGYETSEPNDALNTSLYNLIIEKSMAMKVYGILIDDVLIVEFFDDDNTKISSFLAPSMLPSYTRSQVPAAAAAAAPPVQPVAVPVDEWNEKKEETVYEEPPPVRMPKGRIGSGSFNDRGDFDSDKSRSFNSDNQKFNRRSNQDDDFGSKRGGGRFDKQREDDFGGRGGGGRFDKPRDEDFGGRGGDGWRQKKDRDDFGSGGGNWRNKDGGDDFGKKSFGRSDSEQSGGDWGGDKRSGGGFQSKGSWRSKDGDSNDNESSWRSKDKFDRQDSRGGNKWDRDSSKSDNFKSQKFDNFGGGSRYGGDGDSNSGYKGGKRDFGDKGSWRSDSSSYSKPAVGDRELVEVVYSVSPVDFYVQSTKQSTELTALMEKIAEQYVTGGTVLSSVNEGDYCIAQYKEDEVWYRARVMTSSFGNIAVQFIDYGNSEEVTADQVKEITSELCSLPAQAVKCYLLGASSESGTEWSDEKLTEFSLATEGKTLEAHILAKDFNVDSFKVVLRDLSNPDEEIVINYQFGAADEVLNSITPPAPGEVISFSPFPIELGSTVEIQITWLVSPHQFYVQPLFCNAEFRQMMEHLNRNVKSFTLLGEYEQSVGKSVVTYFKEDKAIYRAVIKESGKVLFVDYGNDGQMDKSHTWAVEPEYAQMPSQAIECTLAGVRPHEEAGAWPAPKTTKLESFFEADAYQCTFHSMTEDGKVVVRLELNGVSVADQLVENRLASKADKEKIVPGTICLVKTEETGYQRAWVWSNSDEASLTVELIDQGGFINIGLDQVYDLADLVAMEPGFAFECSFKAKEDAELDNMKENLENKSVILCVKSSEIPNRLSATVYDTNGNAVSDLIDGEKEKIDVICPLAILQKQQKMVISHAEKGAIYLQRKEHESAITDLITKLYDHYEAEGEVAKSGSDTAWTTGMMCAAKSAADDQWYRAQIVNIEDDLVNVCFSDYGNSELIASERIAVLDESFLADNIYAVKVTLPVQWSVEEGSLLEHFAEKIFDTTFLKVNDSWLVNMIDEEGVELIEKIKELELGTEMEDSPFKKIEVSSRISGFKEGGTFKVCRNHVLSPSQFWVVLSDDFEKTESLQDRLQSLAEHMRPITKNSLQAQKSKVAAKFADEIWYRASYNFEADTVFSVDYGNTEPCTGKLKELPEDLIEPDGFAVECALNIQPVKDLDWDSETKSLFDSLIPDDELILNVLKNNGTNIVVDLIVQNESLSKTLISKELAIEVPITAYISHINSPSDFYIQEEDNQLDKISESLIIAEEFVSIEDIESKKEGIFAAQFSCDGLWYRAKYIEKIEDGGVKVLFVDYGNMDDAHQFRELPEELVTLPFSAKHCSLLLKDSFANWTEVVNAKDRFEELSGGGSTAFTVQIVAEGDPCIVNLLLDGISVSDMLTSVTNQETQQEDEELTLRTKAIVSHINSPSDFYVQFENSALESVSSQLMNADKWNVIENVEENSLVAALFEDSVWYRAQVLSKIDDVVTVMFIDYGNVAPALEVRELPEDLKEITALAEHCRLKLPSGVLEWSQQSIDQFSEMLGYGSVPVEINFLTSDDVPKTVQLTVNDEDVGKHIAKFCESKEKVECSEKGQNIVVCHINSPKDFYVHLDLEAVDEMASNLLTGKTDEACDSENMVGSVVAACFKDDEQWYRAKVISKVEDGYKVKFIDYGNTAVSDEFQQLSSDLVGVPALAKWCCLNSVKTFSPEATDKFRDLAMDGVQEFEMIVIEEDTEPIKVDLIFNGEQLNKILPSVEIVEDNIESNIESGEFIKATTENSTSDEIVNDVENPTVPEETSTLEETVHDIENPIESGEFIKAATENSTSDEIVKNDVENPTVSEETVNAEETSKLEVTVCDIENPTDSGESNKASEENSTSDEIVNGIENPIESKESIEVAKGNSTSDEIVNDIENPTESEESKKVEKNPTLDETVHGIENPTDSTDVVQNGKPMKGEESKKEMCYAKTPISDKIVPGAISSGKLENDDEVD
ncbi:hypothetical protein LSTR_LSTR001120 [Laodelphax striatellus]|uniref:Tudor domain-containing protein n=1 Tax=Laodelphax striatellus TaxID=195883 RepID=A0A482X194_LAOST|nr:hypothetical protein LSTR_LSTR001120 [Laodelphax striatellus]